MLTCMKPLAFAVLGMLGAAALASSARAAECRSDGTAVTGTLAAPQAPCRPRQPAPAPQQRKDRDPPGTFRHGNTTIQFGGTVRMDATTGGR
jgi:hypothetical protein